MRHVRMPYPERHHASAWLFAARGRGYLKNLFAVQTRLYMIVNSYIETNTTCPYNMAIRFSPAN